MSSFSLYEPLAFYIGAWLNLKGSILYNYREICEIENQSYLLQKLPFLLFCKDFLGR